MTARPPQAAPFPLSVTIILRVCCQLAAVNKVCFTLPRVEEVGKVEAGEEEEEGAVAVPTPGCLNSLPKTVVVVDSLPARVPHRFHARRSEVHAGEGAGPREAKQPESRSKRTEVRAQPSNQSKSAVLQSIYGENIQCCTGTPTCYYQYLVVTGHSTSWNDFFDRM